MRPPVAVGDGDAAAPSSHTGSDDDGNGWGRTVMEFIEHCRAKGFDMGEKTNWRSLGADTGKGPQGPPGVLERTASPTSLHKGQEWVLTAVKNPGRLSITYRVEARLMKEMAQDMSGSYRSVRHTSPSFPSFFLQAPHVSWPSDNLEQT